MLLHQWRKRWIALSGVALMVGCVLMPANAYAPTGNAPAQEILTATITQCHNNVFKRGFVDWNKDAWADPVPASKGDVLHEGMQIGTGKDSWAEVNWNHTVITRAWANTVFAVAPNKRLVYLTGGEMLFRLDKHRKDKDQPYYVWTKVLQARIRGTTVLVQAQANLSRITVMEGKIDVYNKLDHSWVTLEPGAVYEVVDKSAKSAAPVTPLTDISYSQDRPMVLFSDDVAETRLYASNSHVMQNHPLISMGETIDSLPLIQAEQAGLPGYNPLLPVKLATLDNQDKTIFHSVQVKGVPKVSYLVGYQVGPGQLELPTSIDAIPPKGTLRPQQPIVANAQVTRPMVAPMPLQLPIRNVGGEAATAADTKALEQPVEAPKPSSSAPQLTDTHSTFVPAAVDAGITSSADKSKSGN
jgi:hypothetical protein